jgi:hypothetical protein
MSLRVVEQVRMGKMKISSICVSFRCSRAIHAKLLIKGSCRFSVLSFVAYMDHN